MAALISALAISRDITEIGEILITERHFGDDREDVTTVSSFAGVAITPLGQAPWGPSVTESGQGRSLAEFSGQGVGSLSELVTERQVSARWNFSLNTLRYWRSVGEGPPFVKIGRSVRYNVPALERYLRRHTCESTTRATAEEVFHRVAH
jgi:hypothetical protein